MTGDRIYNFEDFVYSKFAHDIIFDLGDNHHTHVDNPCTISQLTERLDHSYGLLLSIMRRLGNTAIVSGDERSGNYLTEIGCELYRGLSVLRGIFEKIDESQ